MLLNILLIFGIFSDGLYIGSGVSRIGTFPRSASLLIINSEFGVLSLTGSYYRDEINLDFAGTPVRGYERATGMEISFFHNVKSYTRSKKLYFASFAGLSFERKEDLLEAQTYDYGSLDSSVVNYTGVIKFGSLGILKFMGLNVGVMVILPVVCYSVDETRVFYLEGGYWGSKEASESRSGELAISLFKGKPEWKVFIKTPF